MLKRLPIEKIKEREEEEKFLKFFRELQPLGNVFTGSWGYRLEFNPKAETFSFDHERKTISLGPQIIEKLKLNPEEKRWAFFHELGHFIQLFQSPNDYLESFEISKKEAEKYKKESQKDYVRKIWNRFFNCFFDIHDNSIIRNRMPFYQKGGSQESLPLELYSKKLFPKEDYTDFSYADQFLNFLLKKVMAPEAKVKISPEAENILNQPLTYFGEEYSSLLDFVQKEIFKGERGFKEVFCDIKEILMAKFRGLIEKDVQEDKTQISQPSMDIDIGISEEVIKDFAKSHEEAQKSPFEKMNQHQKDEFEKWTEGAGFDEREIERMEEIRDVTREIEEDMRDLWENFIRRSIEVERTKETRFKTGAGIEPEKLISELPILLTKPSEAEIFYRYVAGEKKETIKPNKINLILISDLSGSMDSQKREAVQEVVYPLAKSLLRFYRDQKVAAIKHRLEPPISIDFRNIGFGGDAKELTQRTPQEDQKRERIDDLQHNLDEDIWRSTLKIGEIDLGGTQDMIPLSQVENLLTSEIKERLKNEEEVFVIIEITDGETTTKEESKQIVERLNQQKGVYARAIQIPGSIYAEKLPPVKETEKEKILKPPEILPPTGIFKEVWEDWGRRLEDLSVLKKTILQILADAIQSKVER